LPDYFLKSPDCSSWTVRAFFYYFLRQSFLFII